MCSLSPSIKEFGAAPYKLNFLPRPETRVCTPLNYSVFWVTAKAYTLMLPDSFLHIGRPSGTGPGNPKNPCLFFPRAQFGFVPLERTRLSQTFPFTSSTLWKLLSLIALSTPRRPSPFNVKDPPAIKLETGTSFDSRFHSVLNKPSPSATTPNPEQMYTWYENFSPSPFLLPL